jgi:hypothetical protein
MLKGHSLFSTEEEQEMVPKKQYNILPFWYMYSHLYSYPPLLPLAMARAVIDNGQTGDKFSKIAAFKLVFCPRGLDCTLKQIVMEPIFKDGGFLFNGRKFFKYWFLNDKKELDKVISMCPSIWVLGMVKDADDKWFHQILEGVIHTISQVYIHCGASSLLRFCTVSRHSSKDLQQGYHLPSKPSPC